MYSKIFLIISTLVVLAACSTTPKKTEWPVDMPPLSYFKDYYRKDPVHMAISTEKQYIKWIRNFYLGSFYYRKGWLDVTEEMLGTLPAPKDKEIADDLLFLIGKKASSEWAKDSRHRLINLRHVMIWGNAINESIVREKQIIALNKIHNDIDALLVKALKASDIKAERYFVVDEEEDDELFF